MFFNAKKLTPVNVGGNGDCGFRSVAAGLIDAFPRVDEDVLKRIFAHYYIYYPKDIPPKESGSLTEAERMDFLLRDYRGSMSQLLKNLAFVLRQMAVNKISADPCKFPGVYADNHENTSLEAMRKAETWIDESAIAALALELDIQIDTAVFERDKKLPLHLTYNKGAKTVVHLQLQDHHYMPEVYNPRLFLAANKPPVHTTEPQAVDHQDRPMSEILKDIEAGMARDRALYEEVHDSLSVMVAEGDVDKQDLLSLYILHMPSSDYLQGRVGQIGVEYNNQDFFLSALRQPDNSAKTTHDERIIAELVHALARGCAIGQIAREELFHTASLHP